MQRVKECMKSRILSPLALGLAFGLCQAALPTSAYAGDWPIFHGPTHDGISTETGWSTSWPEGPKKLWSAKVGVGFSAVSVANGKAYTMGNQNKDTDFVYCFDAKTGKEVWHYSYPCTIDAKYYEGGTHATPTVDGDKVYTVSKHGEVFCFDANSGKVVWSKKVAEELGAKLPEWGFASSAYIEGDLLLLNIGSAGTALDKTSGKVVWKSGTTVAGYSTAVPAKFGNDSTVMFCGKDTVMAVRVKDGSLVWQFPWKTSYDINAADPLLWNNEVFVSSGYNKGCCLVKLEGDKATTVWQSKIIRNHINTGVRLGDYIYAMDGDVDKEGSLRCVEWKTGKEKWAQTIDATGSLMAADGKLIILSGKGELIVAPADPAGFKALARAKVVEGKCWTVPVLANGLIYCRTSQGSLVCLDVSGK